MAESKIADISPTVSKNGPLGDSYEVVVPQDGELKRQLKSRHIGMIAYVQCQRRGDTLMRLTYQGLAEQLARV